LHKITPSALIQQLNEERQKLDSAAVVVVELQTMLKPTRCAEGHAASYLSLRVHVQVPVRRFIVDERMLVIIMPVAARASLYKDTICSVVLAMA
jgi:hypothetical protein